MTAPTSPTEIESVELVESERVGERGSEKTVWRVRLNDAWVSVVEWPEARIESIDPGAGTVWERRIELMLPRGTQLQRVESRPAPPDRRDPLQHLLEARRQPRRVRKKEFRVGRGGRLLDAARRRPRSP